MASTPTNDDSHDEVETVTIRTFNSHDTAALAAANLEAHGIQYWVNADDCGGMYPNLTAAGGGMRLLVHVSDAEAAIALLNAQASPAEINQIEIEAVASALPETVPQKRPAFGQIFSGIVAGVLLCLLYQWANKLGTKTYYHLANDGRRDEAWVYHDGHLAEHLQDRNLDGVWDYWAYHEHGAVVRTELDNNFDGKPDETWTYADGSLVSMEKDTDFNGTPDLFCRYGHGMLQQVDVKPNGSKFVTQRWIYKNVVLTEILRGGDSHGHFEETVCYDPFLNPISTNANQFQLLSPPR